MMVILETPGDSENETWLPIHIWFNETDVDYEGGVDNMTLEEVVTSYVAWKDLPHDVQDNYLLARLGSKQAEPEVAVALTIFYSALLLLGVPGNIMTCLIIAVNKNMRTPTNFFLFNLAITDLFTLVAVMPVEMLLIWRSYPWPFGLFGCEFMTAASEIVSYVSVLTMVAFTFERYTAICYPLRPSLHSGRSRTRYIILAIWIASVFPAFAWTRFMKIKMAKYRNVYEIPESVTCTLGPDEVNGNMAVLTILITLILFIMPIIVLPIVYCKIVSAMKCSQLLQPMTEASVRQQKYRHIVIRMQIAVLVCFLVCWSPYHVQRLSFVVLSLTHGWKKHIFGLYQKLHLFSGCCYYLSCVTNPLLYSLLSHRFRRGFRKMTHSLMSCRFSDQSPVASTMTAPRSADHPMHHQAVSQLDAANTIRMKTLNCSSGIIHTTGFKCKHYQTV